MLEAHAFWQSLLAEREVIIALVDRQGRFQFVNRAWETTMGLTLAEVKGKRLIDLFSSKELHSIFAEDQFLMEQDIGRTRLIAVKLTKDKAEKMLNIKFPLHNDRRQVSGLAVVATYIKETDQDFNAVWQYPTGFRLPITEELTPSAQPEPAAGQQLLQESATQELTRLLYDALEQERKTIAWDLHDKVAQDLAGIRVFCTQLQQTESLSPQAIAQLERIDGLLLDNISFVRELSYGILLPNFKESSLEESLQDYCSSLFAKEKTQWFIDLVDISDQHWSHQKKLHLFRVLQEGLTNVSKHAQASEVGVSARLQNQRVRFWIWDNGQGLSKKGLAAARRSMGFASMKGRIELLGGELSMENREGGGTNILVSLPPLAML